MQPFEGIRVIDLTHVFAGPFCTYQLAVLGADVIKIESPHVPDMTRYEGVVASLNAQGLGTSFLSQNAGKRAFALDLKSEQGVAILKQLVATADVLVENYRGGTLERLGLGYDTLSEANPELIYCSITGFGHTGEKGRDRAYDVIIQAYSGAMAANGEKDSAPVRIGPPMVDYGTGAQAALAVSSALFQRSRTGKGQRIDVAMLDAALMSMSALVVGTLASGESPRALGNAHPDYAGYATYDTSDGMLMVGAFTNEQMRSLMRVLGDDERATAIESMSRADIGDRREADSAFLSRTFAGHCARHWERVLNEAGVPAVRVRQLGETLGEAQLGTRDVLQSYPGNEPCTLPDALPAAAFTFEHGGPSIRSSPPQIGQHTAELLEELGYDASAREALEKLGVVAS